MSSSQAVCRTCGRVVSVSPLRAGADPTAATFFTVDDHAGADGRCAAVGDVVSVPAVQHFAPARTRGPR